MFPGGSMRSVFLAFAFITAVASCVSNDPIKTSGTGGASETGGASSTGGKTGTGGASSTGGKTGTGGASSTGGKTGTGGASSTGGKSGTGGASSTGGKTGTGGTSAAITCPDVSSATSSVTDRYKGTSIALDGNSSKNYYMIPNWWGSPYNNQSESLSGVGFTMTNPNNVVTNVTDTPMGFPSIFIGSYQGHTTDGSKLPKQVSSLTSVPTIFSTNGVEKGMSNYNATYDVWFTANGSPLSSSASSPGSGGAYLMVWLFQPNDRQPRGSIERSGAIISGLHGSWTIWVDSSKDPPCISYVSDSNLDSLEFDLNKFIQNAVSSKLGVTSSQYLSVIFAGFEVWGAGDGLQLKKYCASVE